MRANDHVNRAVGETGQRFAGFFVALKPTQSTQVNGEPGESFVERLGVLANEERRWHEHGNLLTVLNCLERGAHGNLGFAETNVT